ncbi:hypothetical protein L1D14_10640 [Vibrio tubiashii]|uniref:hypothetical protein n=1 Tax=Vibrio tubiashii TaxID=29498 RepID=UPI001EFC5CD0|nr:hypothetical protein [Vibrio tubiashii]MCG9576695.1 hypothetical protein [Vibrio tubiashii]
MRKASVSASLIGQVVRCPYAASRDAQGADIAIEHKERREQGDKYHDHVNQKCIELDSKRGSRWLLLLIIACIALGGLLWSLS